MNVNKLKLNEDKIEFFVASSKSNLKFINEPMSMSSQFISQFHALFNYHLIISRIDYCNSLFWMNCQTHAETTMNTQQSCQIGL